jgi:hypothetical protein
MYDDGNIARVGASEQDLSEYTQTEGAQKSTQGIKGRAGYKKRVESAQWLCIGFVL